VREKSLNDVVTGTDVLVQNLLQQVLHEHEPDIAFLGEEGAPTLPTHSRRIWLVDPICGTTNYAAVVPLWATNVTLVEDGQVTASAVADGATGDLYCAERGRGAWVIGSARLAKLRAAEGRRLISVDPDNRGGVGIYDFSNAYAIEAITRRRWDIRALSSTIALVYVASGRLAGAVYATAGSALHVAAGALLAEEAGAVVTDHACADWTIASPILVVAATRALHHELQSLAAEVYARVIASAGQ
jgi:myo-inositol-1(or 4)-monophosphatase